MLARIGETADKRLGCAERPDVEEKTVSWITLSVLQCIHAKPDSAALAAPAGFYYCWQKGKLRADLCYQRVPILWCRILYYLSRAAQAYLEQEDWQRVSQCFYFVAKVKEALLDQEGQHSAAESWLRYKTLHEATQPED